MCIAMIHAAHQSLEKMVPNAVIVALGGRILSRDN